MAIGSINNLSSLFTEVLSGKQFKSSIATPAVKAFLEAGNLATNNPRKVAQLIRRATELSAALVRGVADLQLDGLDDGVTVVEETNSRKESGPTGTKETTTTTTTRTVDAGKQAVFQRKVADRIQQFGAGLEAGKIKIGNEEITVEQLKQFFLEIAKFAALGEENKVENIDKEVIDIGEDKQPVKKDVVSEPEQPAPDAAFDAIAASLKGQINPEVISSLQAISEQLTPEQLGELVAKVLKS